MWGFPGTEDGTWIYAHSPLKEACKSSYYMREAEIWPEHCVWWYFRKTAEARERTCARKWRDFLELVTFQSDYTLALVAQSPRAAEPARSIHIYKRDKSQAFAEDLGFRCRVFQTAAFSKVRPLPSKPDMLRWLLRDFCAFHEQPRRVTCGFRPHGWMACKSLPSESCVLTFHLISVPCFGHIAPFPFFLKV